MSVIHTIQCRTWTSILVGLFLLCVSAYVVVSHPFRADAGGAPEPPTISFFKASSNTYGPGYPEVELWWRAGATSCSGSNFTVSDSGTVSGFFGYAYGSARVVPGSTTTYTLVCTGPGGSVSSSVTITYTASPPSAAPSAPAISGPTSGTTNTVYTYTFSGSTDPGGGTIRYGIDWNNDGLTDTYTPASGYIASGASSSSTISWSDSGSKTFRVRAEDTSGMVSGWTTHTATITGASLYTWTQQTGAGTGSLWVVSPFSDGSHFVVYRFDGTNGALWGSADGGVTWTQKSAANITSPYYFAASVDGTRLVTVNDSDNYMYSSQNGGSTWTRQDSAGSRDWTAMAVSGNGSHFIAADFSSATGCGTLFYSNDAGITWTQNTVACRYLSVLKESSDGAVLMITDFLGGLEASANVSYNGGATWASLPLPTTVSGGIGITSLSSNGQKVFGGGGPDYFYASSDGGYTWAQQKSLGFGVWNIASSGDGNVLAAISGKHEGSYIYVSRDGGRTWSPQTAAGARQWVTVAVSSDGSRILAGAGGVLDDGYSPVYDYLWTGTLANTAPSASAISGPSTGVINTNYSYTFGPSTDPDGNQIRYALDWNNDGTVDEYAPVTGYLTSGTSHSATHMWSAAGTYPWRVRAEDSLGGASSWTATTTIISAAPDVILTATPTSYRGGDPAITLTWSSNGATNCTSPNFTTGGATNGNATTTPTETTTYTITCTGPGGTDNDSTTVTYTANQAPSTPTIAGPTTGRTGATYTYTVTGSDPEGDAVQFGIDCNGDDTIDSWSTW